MPQQQKKSLVWSAGVIFTTTALLLSTTVYSDGGVKRITSGSHNDSNGEITRKVMDVVNKKTVTKPPNVPVRPIYKRGEVVKHTSKETGIWVTYQDGVYDITEFVDVHPGGERILLAAGQAIDPFWAMFSIHGTAETKELLETYRIGDLIPREHDETAQEEKNHGLDLLFANEPERDPSLRVLAPRPCNAEAALSSLDTFITPNEKFYVRNHLPVPDIDLETYRLTIEGPGIPEGFSLSLEELKKDFPRFSVMATLQCAGNRRKEMHEVQPVKGLQWQSGAISNAVWTGVRLRDVLEKAGYRVEDLSEPDFPHGIEHVVLDGAEGYGASIPIEKALSPRGDVVLAYEMNGEPIPADHGRPLRAVVPGHVAARSVKWLSRIELSDDESLSHWQQRDYKGFSPSADLASSDYSKSQSIQELPVQSSIIQPAPGEPLVVEDGFVTVKGYAISGGGKAINRVDVSKDGGKTWSDAQLTIPPQRRGRTWAWTKWEAKLPVGNETEFEIVCKAVDEAYNTQPDSFAGVYNVRGVLVSAWQRMKTKIVKDN
ncbi:Oxidoreductase, molybdopterin-binding domain-containing protein [Globomyces pollinis-pini]|nr:Oxidoreductase, molybdopterin-binding domain-containing protein [Globomyces pollinis-pini]KAJ2995421.1 hypothetical protein HDV02_000813 [Globomyces sp. JEL0801]